MRTGIRGRKSLMAGVVAAPLMLWGVAAVVAGPVQTDNCGMNGVTNVAASTVADTFVISFAEHSAELSPVAARVLDMVAAAYATQGSVQLRVEGAETPNEPSTLVAMDRLAWVSAYLAIRDVPADAVVVDTRPTGQVGCATSADSAA